MELRKRVQWYKDQKLMLRQNFQIFHKTWDCSRKLNRFSSLISFHQKCWLLIFFLQEYYLGIGDLISVKGVFDITMLNPNGIEKLPGRQIRFSWLKKLNLCGLVHFTAMSEIFKQKLFRTSHDWCCSSQNLNLIWATKKFFWCLGICKWLNGSFTKFIFDPFHWASPKKVKVWKTEVRWG